MTNYDRIKKMSVEEMSENLAETTECEYCPIKCKELNPIQTIKGCKEEFIKWLQSEVSDY